MHKNSHSKMEWFKNTYLDKNHNLKILDVGALDKSGDYNYRDLFNESNWSYTGLDIESGHNVDIVVTDIYNWFEIEDNSYDVIISGQFFEHLEYFWLTMSQIERVLKPNGYVCIIVPSAGHKHGGDMLNCYRFHEDGLKAMAKYVDLKIIHVSIDNRPEAKPWLDACLIARKEENTVENIDELKIQIKDLENKLKTIQDNI
ncbi:methyltransferase domain-containing protein [Methanobrevibacter sp.]|uniref:methyltransferase domain-containing protein n=1 Tax=Methanobrevibacter sp. TaxID=66852 RepID=UPI0025DEB941|nr:methyltransferase domain-containing protein [Methanobrevibacter sp.]MBQ2832685.1 class I SAM-dependent methyltransferase [Methanobrevibacter sp.]